MHTGKHVSIATFTLGFLITALAAQTPDDRLLYQDTLQQRMQRSVSRQLESASRMQASFNLQRQSAQRQTGDVSEVQPFFTLPAPVRMAPRPAANAEAQPVESSNDDPAEHNNGDAPPDSKPEPSRASDAPPAHLMPLIPIGNITLPGIPGIPGIGTAGMIAGNSVRAVLGGRQEGPANRETAAGATAPQNAGVPYIQQLLQALGGDGSPALPNLLGPQQNTAGSYSGRDNAPLTSFSLVDWLFGL